MPEKVSKVDEVNQRILDMLEERKLRRQGGGVSLVQQILAENKKIRVKGTKLPKPPKLPTV